MAVDDKEIFKSRILLADDEAFIRKLVARMLSEIGFSGIVLARDGVEAASILMTADPPIDLAIIDLQMPQVDGFQLIKYIRDTEGFPNPDLPIVILSGHSQHKQVLEATRLGINGYLVKPVSKNNMLSMIKRALSGRKVTVEPDKKFKP